MRRTLALLGVGALIVAVRLAGDPAEGSGMAAMALGFVLLVSFAVGQAARRWGLPSVTGYLLAGMAFGPYLLGRSHPALAVLGHGAVSNLRLLDAVALGLIALSAGGELKLEAVRRFGRTIGAVMLGQVGVVFLSVTALVWGVGGGFPSLAGLSGSALPAAALLLGVIATANSVESALAVIQDYRSAGPVTEVVLAVTVVKDVLVITLFTLALAVAGVLTNPGSAFGGGFLLRLGWEVTGSVLLGIALGWLVAQSLERFGHDLPLLVLAVAFVAVAVLPAWHLSGILTCLVAGFFIENFSPHGDALIKAIERHSLPVYVVFFTIAGAGLNLEALGAALPLALALAGVRLAAIAAGTALGATLAKAPPAVVRHAWSGHIAQAGVTLGFVLLAEQRLPEIGGTLRTVTLAVVALNLVLGPLLFRVGLGLAGEIPPGED
jgi:Kef-type K+ transport system membrane component KefB